MKRAASLTALAVALLLSCVQPLHAEEQNREELRQQIDAINRDTAALDAQNAELRKHITDLEQQTRALAPHALKPQAMQSPVAQPDDDKSIYYWLAGLATLLLVVLAGWRFLVTRRSGA